MELFFKVRLIILDSLVMPFRSLKDTKEHPLNSLEICIKKLLKFTNKYKIAVFF